MIEVTRKFGNTIIKVQGESQKEIWTQLSELGELFGDKECALCKSDDLLPRVREVVDGKKTHQYYELQCNVCRAKLCFGQHSEGGTLFPKRKLKDGQPNQEEGTYGPHKGWHKYVAPKS